MDWEVDIMAAIGGAKVAIAADFLNAFAAIPKNRQGKVLEFITKFKANPLAPGIHYEKITQFKDPTLRTVRIDKNYRGIVKKPESGNIFLLLWVDSHDNAYKWAANKRCTINPETGSLQVYEINDQQMDEIKNAGAEGNDKPAGLFNHIKSKYLIKLGVPAELLPLVRGIDTEAQLDKSVQYFPDEAGEALLALAAGYTLEEVFREFDKDDQKQQPVDQDDYETALKNPDSKRRFFVVEDDLVLQEMLKAPLEKWRVFLHPSQRGLVEREWNGPVRVLGGAGTGKTVVAIHRAKWLAENIFTKDNDKILFTTFTRNLAADIKENLAKICQPEVMRRIEVVNLDRWVSGFLRKNDYNYEIDYFQRAKPLWGKALTLASNELALHEGFYREEWERVIQTHGITTLSEYLRVSRIGRGVRLSRRDRKLIWPVFEEYRLLLNEHNLREMDDAMRDARMLIQAKGNVLPYRAIIVDEAQDMGRQAFQLIRQMIPGGEQKNDLFIVGDAHQRIYRYQVVLGQCGINIRGRGRKLKINYRTTEENRRWAVNLLQGIKFDDLDGGLDSRKGYRSLLSGAEPVVKCFTSFQEEVDYILHYLDQVDGEGGSGSEICLVARTRDMLKQYEGALKAAGRQTYFIRRREPEDRRQPGVRLATMHRVKGLEFDRVIIAGVNDKIVPWEGHGDVSGDPVVKKENEDHERSLLYVAATRAKKEVVVTGFGNISRFLVVDANRNDY